MRRLALIIIIAVVLVLVAGGYFLNRAPGSDATLQTFTVPVDASQSDVVVSLKDKGFIRGSFVFGIFHHGEIKAGGYTLAKNMSAREVAKKLSAGPTLVWVKIPEGLRKEQIAAILADKLGWTEDQEKEWVTTDTAMSADTVEGVYFPDTYLIPLSETPLEVATRLRRRFDDQFAPLAAAAAQQNIKWTTIVKIASLLQREAAGKSDMPIISGIIWNRLDKGMKLQIDATVQYAVETYANYNVDASAWELTYHGQDKKVEDWWKPIKPSDLQIDSVVNTYLHTGLPSRPIANPGLEALKAALSPAKTDCLFYLHDNDRVIHCAATNAQHEANIEKYLK